MVAGAITYAERASFMLHSSSRGVPDGMRRALRYVAPAVFAAIVVPRVFTSGTFDPSSPWWPRMAAVIVGGALMWRFRSMPLTLAAGMAAFWLFRTWS